MKREKRAKKSIISLEKQIEFHKKKQDMVLENKNNELYEYYEKEIEKFKEEIKKKKSILNK